MSITERFLRILIMTVLPCIYTHRNGLYAANQRAVDTDYGQCYAFHEAKPVNYFTGLIRSMQVSIEIAKRPGMKNSIIVGHGL